MKGSICCDFSTFFTLLSAENTQGFNYPTIWSYCGYYHSAELKDQVWPCSYIACSYSSNAYVSAYSGATSFPCPMAFQVGATNDVIWKVWDPGSALSGEINRLRNDKEDGGWASLGEGYQ